MAAFNGASRAVLLFALSVVLASCTAAPSPETTSPAPSETAAPPSPAPVQTKASPQFAFQPIDAAAFKLGTDAKDLAEASIAVHTIAWRAGGWVAGGVRDPWMVGSEILDVAAPVWFSPDGVVWQRVDTPEIFGGTGWHSISRVTADEFAWWVVGRRLYGSPEAPKEEALVWRSTDGRHWTRLEPRCAPGACPKDSTPQVRRIGMPSPQQAAARPGLVLAAGSIDDLPATMWMDDAGVVHSRSRLPTPKWAEPTASWVNSIASGTDSWVMLGVAGQRLADGAIVERRVVWVSADGDEWLAWAGKAGDSIELFMPDVALMTEQFWFMAGAGGVARSVDPNPSTWEMALGTGDDSSYVSSLVKHGRSVVATGWVSGEPPGIWWTSVGTTWGSTRLPVNAQAIAGASDGTLLIVVGTSQADAGAWIAEGRPGG